MHREVAQGRHVVGFDSSRVAGFGGRCLGALWQADDGRCGPKLHLQLPAAPPRRPHRKPFRPEAVVPPRGVGSFLCFKLRCLELGLGGLSASTKGLVFKRAVGSRRDFQSFIAK